jgi:hypothetical protein
VRFSVLAALPNCIAILATESVLPDLGKG